MRCEVCGRSVENPIEVSIEGSRMRTCRECSKFGKRAELKKRKPLRKKPLYKPREEQEDIVQGYGNAIRAAREGKGLTQKELGKRMQEKTSVIARLEAEKMNPSKALAKKLEKALGIKILSAMKEPERVKASTRPRELTLGDVVKIKKKLNDS